MAAVVAAFLLSSCGTEPATPLPPASGRTLRIVSSLPLKGPGAMQASLIRNGIDLAIEERRSLLPGWKVEHLALDGGDAETGGTSVQVEAANARSAADDSTVVVYIGPYTSGAAMVSLPILNQAGLLQALPVATWPGLTQDGWGSGEPARYYPTGRQTMVRLMPPDSAQARVAARKAHRLGAASALVLGDASDYSVGMSAAFEDEAVTLGLRMLARVDLGTGDPGLPALLEQADVVFLAPSNLEAATHAAASIAEHAPGLTVIATDLLLSDRLPHDARSRLEGWYAVFNGDLTPGESERYGGFATAFQVRYATPPSQYAANAYDVTAATLEAASRVGVDRQKILQAVLAGTYEVGAGGRIGFHSNGDRQGGELTLYRLVGGEFELHEELAVP